MDSDADVTADPGPATRTWEQRALEDSRVRRILADGSILVYEGPELRVFNHDGVWERTIGQAGSGPGLGLSALGG